MYNNLEFEKEYIFKRLQEREKQRSMNDFELNVGDLVRYILPRHDGISKKRYRYSKEYYRIESKNGNMYSLIANDGTTIIKPRFLLRKLDQNETERIKMASTIPGKWAGIVKEVLEDIPGNRVRVLFEVPGGEDYEDIIPKSFMSSRFNQTGI